MKVVYEGNVLLRILEVISDAKICNKIIREILVTKSEFDVLEKEVEYSFIAYTGGGYKFPGKPLVRSMMVGGVLIKESV